MGSANSTETQQRQEQTQHEQQQSFTCEICIEPMLPPTKKFTNNNLCAHPFCTDCITKYAQVKIEDDRVAEIKCPGLNCDHLIDPICCRALIPQKLFDKWCDLLCERALLGFERCYCPNRVCSAPVVNECGGTVRRSVCPNCKRVFCFACKAAWHAGYRCEESGQLRDRNDVAFGVLAEVNKWMRCPQCSHCVERVRGCSIVKCRFSLSLYVGVYVFFSIGWEANPPTNYTRKRTESSFIEFELSWVGKRVKNLSLSRNEPSMSYTRMSLLNRGKPALLRQAFV